MKHIRIFLAVIFLVLLSLSQAKATVVALGTFDRDEYVYEDSTILYSQNIRFVTIMTTSNKFNYDHNSKYGGAAARVVIDCSGHSFAFSEGLTVDKKGAILHHKIVPENKLIFGPIEEHTPQYALYRALCVEHPMI
jgi:hypothetical protein